MKKGFSFIFVLLVFLTFCSLLNAQEIRTVDASGPQTGLTVEGFSFTKEEIEKRLSEIEKALKASGQGGQGLSQSDEETLLLAKVKSAYLNLGSALEKRTQLDAEKKLVQEKQSLPEDAVVAQKPPYPLSFYDELLSQLEIIQQKKESAEFAVKTARLFLEDSEVQLENTENQLRDIQETAPDASPAQTEGSDLKKSLVPAELQRELALISFETAAAAVANLEKEMELTALKTTLINSQVEWVRRHLEFDKKDLQMHLDEIAERRKELESLQQKLLGEQKDAEKRWHRAQQTLQNNVYCEKEARLETELSAGEAWLNYYHVALEQIGNRLQLLSTDTEILQNRYDLLKGNSSRDQLSQWEEAVTKHILELNQLLSLQQNYQTTLQAQLSLIETQN